MKIIITEQQYKLLIERTKKFDCKKCDHSWKIEKDDNDPYLCHMCGYDSKNKKYDYDKLKDFWNSYEEENEIDEVIRNKTKKSEITDLVGKVKMKTPIGKLFSFNPKIGEEEEVTEKWSEKYKKGINCNNPKGFSQRAHCQGRKKRQK
jgi:hypothetical protein